MKAYDNIFFNSTDIELIDCPTFNNEFATKDSIYVSKIAFDMGKKHTENVINLYNALYPNAICFYDANKPMIYKFDTMKDLRHKGIHFRSSNFYCTIDKKRFVFIDCGNSLLYCYNFANEFGIDIETTLLKSDWIKINVLGYKIYLSTIGIRVDKRIDFNFG